MPGRLKLAITLALAGLIVGATPVLASNDSHGRTPMARYTGKVQNRVLHDTTAGRQSSFVIELTQQADLSKAYAMKDQDARGWYVYRTLKRTAEKTQGPLKAMLDAQGVSYRSFWVANEIVVHQGGRALVDNLAGRADVKLIEANDASNWLESTAGVELDSLAILKADRPNTIEPGPVQVHAPDLWNLGFTGTGIVVGNQDTGMRWTHNAIKPHYRGWNGSNADHNYNWHDSIHGPIGGQAAEPLRVRHPGAVRRPRARDAHDRSSPSATTAPATRSASPPARSGSAAATWTRASAGPRRTRSASSGSSHRPTSPDRTPIRRSGRT